MHDLHAADKILKLALEQAQKNNLIKIKKIFIKLGRVVEHGAEINAENLVFNIKLLAKNSLASDAEIIVEKIGSDTWELVAIEGD